MTSVVTFAGARVVDPASGRDEIANVVVEGDRVVAVGK
jgi:predicted amidohydrolase